MGNRGRTPSGRGGRLRPHPTPPMHFQGGATAPSRSPPLYMSGGQRYSMNQESIKRTNEQFHDDSSLLTVYVLQIPRAFKCLGRAVPCCAECSVAPSVWLRSQMSSPKSVWCPLRACSSKRPLRACKQRHSLCGVHNLLDIPLV